MAHERLDTYRANLKSTGLLVQALRHPEVVGTIDNMGAYEYSIYQQVLPFLANFTPSEDGHADDERSRGVEQYNQMVKDGKIKSSKFKE